MDGDGNDIKSEDLAKYLETRFAVDRFESTLNGLCYFGLDSIGTMGVAQGLCSLLAVTIAQAARNEELAADIDTVFDTLASGMKEQAKQLGEIADELIPKQEKAETTTEDGEIPNNVSSIFSDKTKLN